MSYDRIGDIDLLAHNWAFRLRKNYLGVEDRLIRYPECNVGCLWRHLTLATRYDL